eukprot:gene25189-biopygen7464
MEIGKHHIFPVPAARRILGQVLQKQAHRRRQGKSLLDRSQPPQLPAVPGTALTLCPGPARCQEIEKLQTAGGNAVPE